MSEWVDDEQERSVKKIHGGGAEVQRQGQREVDRDKRVPLRVVHVQTSATATGHQMRSRTFNLCTA